MSSRTLPAAGVRFEPDFLARVDNLLVRLAGTRERREGAGHSSILGGGTEFAGHRPYRPGEDLRALDWNLLARLDRPFVRVTRREAGERWAVLFDTSASMGVGPPGKLQRAAEVAAALCCLGLREGAHVRLFASPGAESRAEALDLGRRENPGPLLAFLEARRAAGPGGLAALFAGAPRLEAARVFIIGDLFDLEPGALLGLARRGRQISCLQWLAPCEFQPRASDAVEWWDPENGESLRMRLDERAIAAYEARLERRLESWRELAARHGFGFGCWSTETVFEDALLGLVGGGR